MEEIKDYKDFVVELIKFLYINYLFKNLFWKKLSEDEMEDWEELKMIFKVYKKFFIKVFVVYYFDKVDEGVYGKKWKVLCEEIIKMFIFYYESMKIGFGD